MSDRPTLVPLECMRCKTPVPAEPDEVAWSCATCEQGLLLDEGAGLRPITVHFAAGPESAERIPFWVAAGHVRFTRRESYGADSPPDARWAGPVRFVLPAFSTGVEQAVAWGARLLRQPPDLRPGPAGPLRGVSVLPHEIDALARFVVITIEAERRDKLEAIEFYLDLEPPELWCIPVEGA